MDKKNKKVVVTGGAGFIGSYVVKALLEDGCNVSVVDNLLLGRRENVDPRATLHVFNICDLDSLKKVFTESSFVFHLAAIPSVPYSIEHPEETHKANTDGTHNILLAAKEARVKRVIFSSSSAVYGEVNSIPIAESVPVTPLSPYGLHKYIGEEYMKLFSRVYSVETISLRYFNVYGEGQRSEGAYVPVVAKFLDARLLKQPMTITGDGLQTRDFIHVRDVARANVCTMKAEGVFSGEVINIGSGENCSVNAIADMVGGERVHIPPRFEPKNTLADVTLAKKIIAWKPQIFLKEGIISLKKAYGIA